MWTTEHIRKAQRISILLPRCYRTWTTQTESSAHSRMQRQEVPRSASASAMTSTLYLRFSSSFYYGAYGWLQSVTAPLFTAQKSGVVAELGSSCRQSINCSNWPCPFKFCEPQRKKKKVLWQVWHWWHGMEEGEAFPPLPSHWLLQCSSRMSYWNCNVETAWHNVQGLR